MAREAKAARSEEEWTEMLIVFVRGLWAFRYELTALAIGLVAWETLTQPAGELVGPFSSAS